MKPADCAMEPVEAPPEDASLVPLDAVSALAPVATAVVLPVVVVDVPPEVVPLATAVVPLVVAVDVPVFTEVVEVAIITGLVVKLLTGCEAGAESLS